MTKLFLSDSFAKGNKYKNKKVTVDGETFDSEHEYQRWYRLKLLERAGAITDLQRQVRFELIPSQYEYFARYGKDGKRLKDGRRCLEKSVVYVADFVYTEKGKQIVEDAKGLKTEAYKIKRKLMLSVHKIRVREV